MLANHPRQLSPLSSRILMVCAAIAVIGYVAMLSAFSTSEFPSSMVSASHWPALMDKPVGEDGYYMLTVADNIATKGHILYNRGVPATGVQPLATVVFAVLDAAVHLFGGGADALIRCVMALGAILFIGFAWQISRLAAALAPENLRRYASLFAFLLALSSYTLFRLFLYGLETGFYLLLIAACFQVTLRIAAAGNTALRDALLLGLAAGMAGEARIDFGLMFAILLITLLIYRWMSPGKALLAGAIALLVVSPWFLFVHSVSGSWLPSSGKAESTLVAEGTLLKRVGTMAVAVTGELMPWCYAVLSRGTVIVALVSVAGLVWLLGTRPRLRHLLAGMLLSRLGVLWLVPLLSLVPVYLLLFNATHFYYRYTAPLSVAMLPICAIVLAESEWVRQHTVALAAGLGIAFACWTAGALHTGHVGNSQTIAAGYVHRQFPDAHVGAFQSGVMGYFNRNVENLDGKLNQGALNAAARHQLPAFIDSEGIDVLVDWPSVVHANLPPAYLQQHWRPCPVPIGGDSESICLLRKSPDGHLSGKPQV